MYKVHVTKPKALTLHYTNHEITVTNLKILDGTCLINNVKQEEMDELFRSGIVLGVEKEDEPDL